MRIAAVMYEVLKRDGICQVLHRYFAAFLNPQKEEMRMGSNFEKKWTPWLILSTTYTTRGRGCDEGRS